MRIALTIFGTLAVAVSAHAADQTATDVLKARDAEIRAALPPKGEKVTPVIKDRLQAVLTKLVDLEAMAKTTLGKHWDAQTPAKQKQFLDVFLKAFRNAVGGEIEFYRSSNTSFSAEVKKDASVEVPTELMVKDEPTEIIYTMKKDDAGGWRITDITIDGVSTVQNYRASFNKIIAEKGFDELIKRLEKPAS